MVGILRRFEARDVLLKRVVFFLRLIPRWVALPFVLGGSLALYNFWTARLESTPPLNIFGFMFAGVCVFAGLVAGIRDLERRNREARMLRRQQVFHFDSPQVMEDAGSRMPGSMGNGAGRSERPDCKQNTGLRMGAKTQFSRNVVSGCVNTPVCKHKSGSRSTRQITPNSQRRSQSGGAAAE
jgi:hypothetical protein